MTDDYEEPEMMLLANHDESSNGHDVQGTPVEELWDEIKKALTKSALEENQRQQLLSMLHGYVDVFGLSYQDLSQTNLLEFHVETGDVRPIICQPNRFMSHSELEQLREEVDERVKDN